MIAAKVANALALDYPRERLELIVASDGSADATVERARAAGADLVLDLPRGGKIAAQNAAAERASGEILAFSDANSDWAPDALRHLVEPFADPAVGYACGQVRFTDAGRRQPRGRLLALRDGGAGDGVGAGRRHRRQRRDLRGPRAAPTSRLPPSGSHDLSFPFALAKRGLRSLYVPWARAEEKMVPTLEGEFARKRRMMVGLWDIVVGEGMLAPARLLAALRLRARLAPAAALPDPAPAPDRLRRQRRPARRGLGLHGDARAPARRHRRRAPRPLAAARPAPHRPLLRDDDRLDRRRPLGPRPPRPAGGLGEGRGNDDDAARPRHRDRRPRAGRPLAAAADRGDRDQARQPRPGALPPAPRRQGRARVRDAEAAHDGRRAPTRSGSAPSSPATTPASPAPAASCAAPRSTRSPTWSTSCAARWRSSAPARRSPPRSRTTRRASTAATRSCPGSPAGPRSRAAPASPGRSGSSSTSSTSTTAPPPSTSASSPRPPGCSSPATASPRTDRRWADLSRYRPVLGSSVARVKVLAVTESAGGQPATRSSPAMPPPSTAGSTTPRRRRR